MAPTAPVRRRSSVLLCLQASSTLLSWCEASGHVRLWQLLSTTCRPAWQQLAASAAASVPGSASAGAVISTAQDATTTSLNTLQWLQLQQQQSLAGPLQLLCPQLWQQQLVCLLVREPSVLDLLLLLQQLPGLAVQQQQQHLSQQARGGGAVSNMQTNADDGADAASLWSSEELLSWPNPREWGRPAAAHPVQGANRLQQQAPVRETRGEVSLQLQPECGVAFGLCL